MTKIDANHIDEIVGQHQTVYDIYFSQADLTGSGIISAIDAGLFLKKSKLNDVVLKNIWDLVDPTGKGYLDRHTFYITLKLIALAQANIDVKLDNLSVSTNAPKLGDIATNMISLIQPDDHWYIKASSRIDFDKRFDQLQPMNNKLLGSRVKPYLMNTGLPIDVLGKIWELSDLDQDGQLSRSEFHISLQLVAKSKEGINIPDQLPPSLLPFKTRSTVHISEVKTWIVTAEEKAKHDKIFATLDTDKDGYINGAEVKDVFLQSGLQQITLANIWSLCDTYSTGRLNSEQFALAMHFVNKKIENGIEPPMHLTPEMIPPSCRPKQTNEGTKVDKDLEDLQTQVTELQREKLYYEQRASEHELQIRQKRTELSNYELEMDSLFKTLREREINRSEEQKRLNDYEDKINRLNTQLGEIKSIYETEKNEIDGIKFQITNIHTTALNKENDLNKIKNDLQMLRNEKSSLEMRATNRRQQLSELQNQLKYLSEEKTENQDQLNNIKSLQTNLNRLLKEYGFALSNDGKNFDVLKKLEEENVVLREKIENGVKSPTFRGMKSSASTSKSMLQQVQSPVTNMFNDNAFEDMLSSTSITNAVDTSLQQTDPFGTFDPFGAGANDPFGTKQSANTSNAFAGSDPFGANDFDAFADKAASFDSKRKLPPPRPAPPRPFTPSLKPVKPVDNTKRPQSALDFTYNKKMDLFADFDPFSSTQTTTPAANWPAFTSNANQFDPFA